MKGIVFGAIVGRSEQDLLSTARAALHRMHHGLHAIGLSLSLGLSLGLSLSLGLLHPGLV